jgi:hypothetical protein
MLTRVEPPLVRRVVLERRANVDAVHVELRGGRTATIITEPGDGAYIANRLLCDDSCDPEISTRLDQAGFAAWPGYGEEPTNA